MAVRSSATRQACFDNEPANGMAQFHRRATRAENCSLAMAGAVGALELERHCGRECPVTLPAANDLIEDPGGAPFPSLQLQAAARPASTTLEAGPP